MSTKERLSASVDSDLLAAAHEAAARGQSGNLSAWISDALRLKLDHDRRLAALGSFLAAYEAEHGVIDDAEVARANRSAQRRAVHVPGKAPEKQGATSRKAPRGRRRWA